MIILNFKRKNIMYQVSLNINGETMKITKISLAILILICTIGIVAAAEVSDFKVADGYKDYTAGSYMNDAENIEIDILDEKDIGDLDDAFENDSDVKYTVTPGKLNNTFNFTDGVNEGFGVLELVKINDKNYVIEVWTTSDNKDITLDKQYDTLEEVNKLNNIEPLDISILDD